MVRCFENNSRIARKIEKNKKVQKKISDVTVLIHDKKEQKTWLNLDFPSKKSLKVDHF
jgi:hypothetical protein